MSDNINAAEVRKWARELGLHVGTRGRLHPNLVKAYQEANGIKPEADCPPVPPAPHAQ